MTAERPPLLSGVRIVAFTQWLLGPAAVQYLNDMGADVIKVERPGAGAFERGWSGGETYLNGESVFFMLTHRNVRSLSLDLKHPDGQAIARRLVETADVIVENFRPGVLASLGLGYDEVSDLNPDIVYASASGYGTDDTPYRDLPGQDLLVQAMTGLVAASGHGDEPVPTGAAVVDQHAGLLLATGILGALLARERTGHGQRVEVNMVEAALDLQLEPFLYHLNGGRVRRPSVPLASTFHEAPYGIYATSDGHIALSLSPIAMISEALGSPPELDRFRSREAAVNERDAIYEALRPYLQAETTAALVERLRGHGVWCAPVNDYDAVVDDPGVRHLDPVLELDHPKAGPVRLLKHPIHYSDAEPAIDRMPPAVGEHTDEILRELGYSGDEIDELRAATRPPESAP